MVDISSGWPVKEIYQSYFTIEIMMLTNISTAMKVNNNNTVKHVKIRIYCEIKVTLQVLNNFSIYTLK
jgi:hypothetical protein